MPDTPVRYRSSDEDSGRWDGFPFRHGDIVISTRSKHGTTWLQMICALLVFRTPDLPATLGRLSPWLDWLVAPRDEVVARLQAQTHRRFIKTHTPLDGVPRRPGVTYIVVARHPLDAAVSLYHHSDNIDRDRMSELIGDSYTPPKSSTGPRPPLDEWLRAWIEWEGPHAGHLDSLPGVMWHLSGAWARRDDADTVLVHFEDLNTGLEGEMRRLAGRLGIEIPDGRWPQLVDAAGFGAMRSRAAELIPGSVLKDPAAFFRGGVSGTGRAALTADDLVRYEERAAALASPGLLAWLHRP